jgi:hypothetical protein
MLIVRIKFAKGYLMLKRIHALTSGLLAVGLFLMAVSVLPAVEIAPASAQDILSALGPDAEGLALSQEALPDLFTLTARRLDENAKQFIVQLPYKSGRWKRGKVVIEYSRDLSYTTVSVYDREGNRQRIYSVNSKFTEYVAKLKSQAQSQPKPLTEAPPPPPPAVPQIAQAVSRGVFSYEWNDAKNAYLPVESKPPPPPVVHETPAPPPLPAPPHPDGEKKTPVAKAQSKPAPSSKTGGDIWTPSKSDASSPVQVKVGNTTWVEKHKDLPAKSKPAPPHPHIKPAEIKPTPKPAAKPVAVPEAKPAPIPVATPAPVPEAKPVPVPVAASTPEPVPPALKTPVVEQAVPSEDELLGIKPGEHKEKSAVVAPVKETPPSSAPLLAPEASESDVSVPSKIKPPKLDVEIDRDEQRLRAEENKLAAERQEARMKKDAAHSEEGVLPVSAFEKLSGALFGRHREYERHFVPGRNKSVEAPGHDFYVDEVDRKKGTHNVYYYAHQKGKGPSLVAVERHDKVSFQKNYDIDKEDKGKVSTYH